MTKTRRAIEACAAWLSACLRLGWAKSNLDMLEELWWRYHDETGKPLYLDEGQS